MATTETVASALVDEITYQSNRDPDLARYAIDALLDANMPVGYEHDSDVVFCGSRGAWAVNARWVRAEGGCIDNAAGRAFVAETLSRAGELLRAIGE